jgi:hypothetical protein
MLERALFWARASSVFFIALALAAVIVSSYLAGRLDSLRRAQSVKLEEMVRTLQEQQRAPETIALPQGEPNPKERHVDEPGHKRIMEALESFGGARVNVISLPEWEPGNYAHQIVKTLRAAGLDVKVSYFDQNQSVPEGVTCYWSRNDEANGQALTAAISKAGLQCAAKRGLPRGTAIVELQVGRKPAD